MITGKKWFNNDIIYTKFKKHNCFFCGELLDLVKVSKVVNSESPEAKDFDFSFSAGFMVGDVKFVWDEFECPKCKHHYTIRELKEFERENIIFDNQIRELVKRKEDEYIIQYSDSAGVQHTIELEQCAKNYKCENHIDSENCVGVRKMDDNYFLLYTNYIKKKIVFKRSYVFHSGKQKLLTGSRNSRFIQFQKLLNDVKYTTYDLS